MNEPRKRATPGGLWRRHLLITAMAMLVVAATVVVGEVIIARAATERRLHQTTERVMHAMADVLTGSDFSAGPGAIDRDAVLADLKGFYAADFLHRIKVWRVEGENVRVVFSDEARLEGETRPFSSDLARRLDAGEIVVFDVPDDHEHRFEQDAETDLKEAFIGFEDSEGAPMRLEVYLAVSTTESTLTALRVQIPLVIGAIVVLAALLLPLTARVARKVGRLAGERAQALEYGLAASERERRVLAGKLHDGAIQDLAAVSLALRSMANDERDPETTQQMLDRLADVISADVVELRHLAQQSTWPVADEGSLREYLADLARRDPRAPEVQVTAGPLDGASRHQAELAWRTATELARNAIEHAGATRVEVMLTTDPADHSIEVSVVDDGAGFDPDAIESGHLGIALVRLAVTEAGGHLDLDSAPGRGTVASVRLPPHDPGLAAGIAD